MTAGLFAGLTRTELDCLLADAEHATVKSQIAFTNTPLWAGPAVLQSRCGVAQDCMSLLSAALDESIARMSAGEIPA